MNKKLKRVLYGVGALFGVLLVTGCTASFCSPKDTASIMFAYDQGVVRYVEEGTEGAIQHETYPNLYYTTSAEYSPTLMSVYTQAQNDSIVQPVLDFFVQIDLRALDAMVEQYNKDFVEPITNEQVDYSFVNDELIYKLKDDGVTRYVHYGYVKFLGENDELWSNWDKWSAELAIELGPENVPNMDFTNLYKRTMNNYVATTRSCITINGGAYGSYGPQGSQTEVNIEKKDWGYAWKTGPIEGLLVYPVAWLVDFFATSFGAGGWGQIGAILLVTLIVRGLLLLISFKSTSSQAKMQAIQPELAKIQAKYPNSKTNQYEKQRLTQEQMALYKKHKISMIAPFITMIIQFPIFIAVWGAMQGAAILSSDAIFGLKLSDSIGSTLIQFNNWHAWGTAFVLIILMIVAQIVATKLPQWMQKRKLKKLARLGKNPAQAAQNKQMKWISNIMLVVIIFMGFTLPAAMGVYWFAGALIMIAQTLVMDAVTKHKEKKQKEAKKGKKY